MVAGSMVAVIIKCLKINAQHSRVCAFVALLWHSCRATPSDKNPAQAAFARRAARLQAHFLNGGRTPST